MTDVRIGNYHQMTGRVRIAVEHDEAILCAMKDKVLAVFLLANHSAEDATLLFWSADKISAPRGEHMLGHGRRIISNPKTPRKRNKYGYLRL